MPKSIKSKEDIARLKEIKQYLIEHFSKVKELKTAIKNLKVERKAILAKYPSVQNV